MSHAKENDRYKSVDGKNNPNSKLTEKQVEYIRENYIPYHKKYGRSNLSKTFNVTPKTIHDITHNKSWINKT
jgi:predicted DNA-binding protein YlxM (UPF0122 family)